MKTALPPSLFSKDQYPKVFAWLGQFSEALKRAKTSGREPVRLKGADALKQITQADFAEPEYDVDRSDPTGLEKGAQFESWPSR